jgi:Leucine-rich repeat (LRR) protein
MTRINVIFLLLVVLMSCGNSSQSSKNIRTDQDTVHKVTQRDTSRYFLYGKRKYFALDSLTKVSAPFSDYFEIHNKPLSEVLKFPFRSSIKYLAIFNVESREVLSSIFGEACQFENLEMLTIIKSKISANNFPNCSKWTNVNTLQLIECPINDSLPNDIYQWMNLSQLVVNNCGILGVSNKVSNLQNLGWLNLSFNKIETLPVSIGSLSHLKKLEVSDNDLKLIPDNAFSFKKIEYINIQNNKELNNIPNSLFKSSTITALGILGCDKLINNQELQKKIRKKLPHCEIM